MIRTDNGIPFAPPVRFLLDEPNSLNFSKQILDVLVLVMFSIDLQRAFASPNVPNSFVDWFHSQNIFLQDMAWSKLWNTKSRCLYFTPLLIPMKWWLSYILNLFRSDWCHSLILFLSLAWWTWLHFVFQLSPECNWLTTQLLKFHSILDTCE